jgi:hypothetical protein
MTDHAAISKATAYTHTGIPDTNISKATAYVHVGINISAISKATVYVHGGAPDLSGDLYQHNNSRRPIYQANDPPATLPYADQLVNERYFHVYINVAGSYYFFVMFPNGLINEFPMMLTQGENVLNIGFDFTQIFAVYNDPPMTPLVRDMIRAAMTAANPS